MYRTKKQNILKLKSNNESKNKIIVKETKLMMILGALINYKDFKNTAWLKQNLPLLNEQQRNINDKEISEHPPKSLSKSDEWPIDPEKIDNIFKKFTQRVSSISLVRY